MNWKHDASVICHCIYHWSRSLSSLYLFPSDCVYARILHPLAGHFNRPSWINKAFLVCPSLSPVHASWQGHPPAQSEMRRTTLPSRRTIPCKWQVNICDMGPGPVMNDDGNVTLFCNAYYTPIEHFISDYWWTNKTIQHTLKRMFNHGMWPRSLPKHSALKTQDLEYAQKSFDWMVSVMPRITGALHFWSLSLGPFSLKSVDLFASALAPAFLVLSTSSSSGSISFKLSSSCKLHWQSLSSDMHWFKFMSIFLLLNFRLRWIMDYDLLYVWVFDCIFATSSS